MNREAWLKGWKRLTRKAYRWLKTGAPIIPKQWRLGRKARGPEPPAKIEARWPEYVSGLRSWTCNLTVTTNSLEAEKEQKDVFRLLGLPNELIVEGGGRRYQGMALMTVSYPLVFGEDDHCHWRLDFCGSGPLTREPGGEETSASFGSMIFRGQIRYVFAQEMMPDVSLEKMFANLDEELEAE